MGRIGVGLECAIMSGAGTTGSLSSTKRFFMGDSSEDANKMVVAEGEEEEEVDGNVEPPAGVGS